MPDFSTYEGRQAYRDANPGAIVDASGAYNPSTGQTTSGDGATPSSPSPPSTPDTGNYANLTATQMVLNSAQAKANQAYLNARLQLDNDTLAFNKATEAFNETIAVAQQ